MSEREGHGQKDLIRLGGLWRKTGRNGQTFLSGSLGQAGILIFKNMGKDKDTQPDYVMYVAPGQEREARATESRPSSAQAQDDRL